MKRVLIVDDDRATSAGMADVVEEWGYEPEVADTVKAGWNAVNIDNEDSFHLAPKGRDSRRTTLSRSCAA